jgi:hypothetical protein
MESKYATGGGLATLAWLSIPTLPVIPGWSEGPGPESISPSILAAPWIPGLVLAQHPGMTE